MDIQEFFYWSASIVLILIGFFIISAFMVLFYIKRLVDKTALNVLQKVDNMTEHVTSVGRTWRNLTLTRFVLRALRLIF